MKKLLSLLLCLLCCASLAMPALAEAGDDLTQGTLTELIEQGIIEVTVTGMSIDWTTITIENLSKNEISVVLPIGTFFEASSKKVQSMLVVYEYEYYIKPGESWTDEVSTTCMNIERDIPSEDNDFSAQMLDEDSDLLLVLPIFDERDSGYAIRQAVVWMLTDNANYEDLGTLTSNGERFITREHYDEALDILKEAGLR